MWLYEKKLAFPVNIKKPDPRMAKLIITQYGGGDGELGAALRYLSQRFTMPTGKTRALLNDIGIEDKIVHFKRIYRPLKKGMRKYSKNRRLLQIVYKMRQQKTRGKNLWSIVVICFIALFISLV